MYLYYSLSVLFSVVCQKSALLLSSNTDGGGCFGGIATVGGCTMLARSGIEKNLGRGELLPQEGRKVETLDLAGQDVVSVMVGNRYVGADMDSDFHPTTLFIDLCIMLSPQKRPNTDSRGHLEEDRG